MRVLASVSKPGDLLSMDPGAFRHEFQEEDDEGSFFAAARRRWFGGGSDSNADDSAKLIGAKSEAVRVVEGKRKTAMDDSLAVQEAIQALVGGSTDADDDDAAAGAASGPPTQAPAMQDQALPGIAAIGAYPKQRYALTQQQQQHVAAFEPLASVGSARLLPSASPPPQGRPAGGGRTVTFATPIQLPHLPRRGHEADGPASDFAAGSFPMPAAAFASTDDGVPFLPSASGTAGAPAASRPPAGRGHRPNPVVRGVAATPLSVPTPLQPARDPSRAGVAESKDDDGDEGAGMVGGGIAAPAVSAPPAGPRSRVAQAGESLWRQHVAQAQQLAGPA